MKLEKLLDEAFLGCVNSSFRTLDIQSIGCDSRKVTEGSLFVALKGSAHNGADFINDAVHKGASVIVAEDIAKILPLKFPHVCFVTAEDPIDFLHEVTERFYDYPSKKVKTIGITGTNGKTTVAYLIESILKEAGQACGVIGTVNYRMAGKSRPAWQTTPGYIDNQILLSELARAQIPYCVMEVSSHALTQDRVYGIDFRTAVFTNFTSDHLDYHLTRENYFTAKAALFTPLSPEGNAVINTDDIYGQQLCAMTEAKIIRFGFGKEADVTAKDIQMDISGSRFTLITRTGEILVTTSLIGHFNISNILAAVAACLIEGLGLEVIQKGIKHLTCVPGRLEKVEGGQNFPIFIDYAHTQDALENVLQTIRQVSQARLILVFGCGGDRDTSKRPLMGKTADEWADYSIVTSDNPRSEDPQAIIDQVISGFEKNQYKVIVDREKAIQEALGMAGAKDIVLIAGKGHEQYQVLANERIDFDERKIIENYYHAHR